MGDDNKYMDPVFDPGLPPLPKDPKAEYILRAKIEIPKKRGEEMKKYFVIADVHAMYEMMMLELFEAGFDLHNPDHIVITLGDNLDRGDGGLDVLLFLSMMYQQNRLLGVLGNHDKMLLDWVDGNMSRVAFNIQQNGFGKTVDLALKPDKAGSFTNLQTLKEAAVEFARRYPDYVKFLRECPLYLEFEKHIFVHGALNFQLKDWRKTGVQFATWEYQTRHRIPEDLGKTVIVGHQPTITMIRTGNRVIDDMNYGKPMRFNNLILLDGGAVNGGRMNVLVFDEADL